MPNVPKSKKPRKPRTNNRKSSNKTFKKRVTAIISSLAEDKQAYHSTSETVLTNFNSQINQLGDMLQILPNISRGTDENNRIGDQIRAKKLNISGYIRFSPNFGGNVASGACQVGVRMFIVSPKSKYNLNDVQSSNNLINALLRRGATTSAFTGIISDLTAPVNTELWTVHSNKVFYLTQTFNNYATQVGYWETDVKNTLKFFKVSLKVKNKLLRYDDDLSSGLQPLNYSPILLLGYVYLNGVQAPDVVATNLGLFYSTQMTYEDM